MTLRNILLGLALAALLAGIGLIAAGLLTGIPFVIGGGVFALLVFGERWRYGRSHRVGNGGHFEETGERYRDPATGEMMKVLFDARTGARRYVRTAESPDP